MNIAETFRVAVSAIASHRLRSALTVMGIWIGVASVVVVVGLGTGSSASITESIGALGSQQLTVQASSQGSGAGLSTEDAAALADKTIAPDVAQVAGVATGQQTTLSVGTTTFDSQITATSTDWLKVQSSTVENGRFFTDGEYAAGAAVIVLGASAAEDLFGSGAAAVGQSVTINGSQFTVIGALRASSGFGGTDDATVMPYSTAVARAGVTDGTLTSIQVIATSADRLSAAYQEINQALLTRHNVTADKADFQITSQSSILDTLQQTTQTFTVLIGGIAAISLLVGGIGVANIMLVSVTERIKEIGLRKALGATPAVIRRQFLMEAVMLGLIGGVIGVAVGYGLGAILPSIVGSAVTIPPTATLAALAVAVGVGIVAGVYPASRAARLAPIDALRSE
jgi:putative ABC transport system permease protein